MPDFTCLDENLFAKVAQTLLQHISSTHCNFKSALGPSIPYNYLFLKCHASISRIMNAKKSRNSRGKTRANETHFYTICLQFLFSFTRTFMQNDSLQFFSKPC
jgi:hypothetical protein